MKGSAPQWQGLEPGDFLAASRAFAFRLLNIAGAECHRALIHPHTLYPWKAFGLVAGVLKGDFTSLTAWEFDMLRLVGQVKSYPESSLHVINVNRSIERALPRTVIEAS